MEDINDPDMVDDKASEYNEFIINLTYQLIIKLMNQ